MLPWVTVLIYTSIIFVIYSDEIKWRHLLASPTANKKGHSKSPLEFQRRSTMSHTAIGSTKIQLN